MTCILVPVRGDIQACRPSDGHNERSAHPSSCSMEDHAIEEFRLLVFIECVRWSDEGRKQAAKALKSRTPGTDLGEMNVRSCNSDID